MAYIYAEIDARQKLSDAERRATETPDQAEREAAAGLPRLRLSVLQLKI